MVRKSKSQPDLFAQNLDPLIEPPQCADLDTMATLALVENDDDSAFGFDFEEQHTLDHIDCPACKAANVALQAEKLNISGLQFSQAAKFWMLLRRQSARLKPRTHETTQGYLDALEKFFGKLRLRDITPGHLRGYQIARMKNLMRVAGGDLHPWKHPAGNSIVNHEISVLGQMLRHCRLWHRVRPFYFPRPTQHWSPREILSEEDEDLFFKKAARHPEAQLAYWVAAITNNTTAAGGELRGLRLKHLFLSDDDISEIYIPEEAVKNDSRPRKIALNPTAKWAVEECYKRALKLGCSEPDDFLFPGRLKRNTYDPKRPPSRFFLRRSWEKLRRATGFTELCPHDLRHHCITRLLENDVSPETVTAIAGHRPNSKMLEYYAHQRRRVKYAAVLAIEPAAKKKLPARAAAQNRKQA